MCIFTFSYEEPVYKYTYLNLKGLQWTEKQFSVHGEGNNFRGSESQVMLQPIESDSNEQLIMKLRLICKASDQFIKTNWVIRVIHKSNMFVVVCSKHGQNNRKMCSTFAFVVFLKSF